MSMAERYRDPPDGPLARVGRLTGAGRLALISLLALSSAACALHWPWKHRPAPPPQPVQQLAIVPDTAGAGPSILQFWDRNALLVDLTGVSGDGGATLTPLQSGWPIRLEFRVQPGSFATLEIEAAQRVLYQVPAQGKALLLHLPPSALHPDTHQLTLRWRATDDSAH
jgi:hypothetical protein